MENERVIVHVDMDAFFASVEQRDNPEYRGKPVVVGADPKGGHGRGVAATCSYEARQYGIHSAMPISQAFRLCPNAVFLRGRMDVYEDVSREIFRILEQFTPDVEPVGIDEAFLDVTRTARLFGDKRALAEKLQKRIEEQTGLTASLGLGPNKLIAKIASDMKKPRGLVIVEPHEVEAFLRPLPVEKLWGVGKKTAAVLHELGVRTIGDLAGTDSGEMIRRFGKHGECMWELAHGRDESQVEVSWVVKSVGNEHTFEHDTDSPKLVEATLMQLSESVAHRLRQAGLRGRTVTVKIRFENFTTLTRSETVERLLDSAPEIFEIATSNLERVRMKDHKVRLVGVSVSGLEEPGGQRQTLLFESSHEDRERERKRRLLAQAIDRIKERYGENALRQGTSLLGPEPPETPERRAKPER